MNPWLEKRPILITCPKGIAPWLAAEMRALGHPVTGTGEAHVETEGTLTATFGLALQLRTAHRILYRLASFSADTPDSLYAALRRLPWEGILHEGGEHAYLSVTSTVETATIRDARYVNLRAKDAIVDRLQERLGRRPDSGPDRGRAVVHLYWKQNDAAVYLDATGEPLNRRGYRKIPLAAPMQETLAAAVILASGWNGQGAFVNPMCGSGTLAIEAALLAAGRAPGLLRGNFGFFHLKGFDPVRWRKARLEAQARKRTPAVPIVATDVNPKAVEAARQNARTAGVEELIAFRTCAFAVTDLPEPKGVVVLNPPYGERTGDVDELGGLYRQIGDFFKQRCSGWGGYLFTANLSLAKEVGLRTKRRIPFYNGELACRLLEYELYEGSRRKGEGDDLP